MFPLARTLRRGLLAAALAMAMAPPTAGRSFTVEDLLAMEALGQVAVDPTGRWLVIERRGPYVLNPAFDYTVRNDVAGSRLRLVDLRSPGPARPLIPGSDGPGETAMAFSPDGAELAIYRLRD